MINTRERFQLRLLKGSLMFFIMALSFGCENSQNHQTLEPSPTGNKDSAVAPRTTDNYILGADISSLKELEDNGVTFIDTDGIEKSLLDLLKSHGFNYIRLRTFVNPTTDYGYASDDGQWCSGKSKAYNDKNHIVALAQRVKSSGMKLLLDFHYSDTWADPNKQVIPQEWRHLTTINELSAVVEEYTFDVLNALKQLGATPDMVQVGNEITHGMMVHIPTEKTDCYGNNSIISPNVNGSTANWDNLASLLKAGIKAVDDVDPNIEVMLHVENTGDPEGVLSWVQNATSRDVRFDVLGLSAYEKWQGPSVKWKSTFDKFATALPDLQFSIVEYNPEIKLLNDIMYQLPNSKGAGTFFWEPALSGEWGESMFTINGNVYTAKPERFKIYDQITAEYGL